MGSRVTPAPIEHRRTNTVRIVSADTVSRRWLDGIAAFGRTTRESAECWLTRPQHWSRADLRDPLPVIRDGALGLMAEPHRSLEGATPRSE